MVNFGQEYSTSLNLLKIRSSYDQIVLLIYQIQCILLDPICAALYPVALSTSIIKASPYSLTLMFMKLPKIASEHSWLLRS